MYNRIMKYVEIEIYRNREIFFQGRSQEPSLFWSVGVGVGGTPGVGVLIGVGKFTSSTPKS